MATAVRSGACDAVACARAFIADPHLYRHLREEGAARPACVWCNACSGAAGAEPVDCYHPRVRRAQTAALAQDGAAGLRDGAGRPPC